MSFYMFCVMLALSLISVTSFAEEVEDEKKAFTDYSQKIQVPEPLYIDLVRSLDAEKGEWEINSLFSQTDPSFHETQWAPEIEWAFANGSAVELELPMQGGTLKNYKVALQHTLSRDMETRTLHGVQAIFEAERKRFGHNLGTLYYILAHRFDHHWSTILLLGPRASSYSKGTVEWSLNQTLFYNYSKQVDFGLEFNAVTGEVEQKYWQAIPQLHLAFREGYKIQVGFGARYEDNQTEAISTFRLIREFNH